MNIEIIAQIIGFIAFALGITAFLQKDDKKLRMIMTAQGLTLSLHFFLLGAHTGAALACISGIRNLMSVFSWGKKLAPFFYALILFMGWYTYESPVNLLPVFAGLIAVAAFFFLSGIRLRLALVCGSSLWLIHNIFVGSIGPSIMEAFMVCAGLYRTWKLSLEHKKAIGNDEALTP
jgi:hypothetical protein